MYIHVYVGFAKGNASLPAEKKANKGVSKGGAGMASRSQSRGSSGVVDGKWLSPALKPRAAYACTYVLFRLLRITTCMSDCETRPVASRELCALGDKLQGQSSFSDEKNHCWQ
jgi:hypothetical protein